MLVNDNYDHPYNNLEYICENILSTVADDNEYSNLQSMYNSAITKCCNCLNSSCDDYPDCIHGANYTYLNNELVLNKSRHSKDVLYECTEECTCPEDCFNRLVQKGPRMNLKIVKVMEIRSGLDENFSTQNALVTTEFIPEGAYICEYAGELLTKAEALRRCNRNDATNQMNYVMCLNELPLVGGNASQLLQTFVDPGRCGNIGRYLNHSCDPNCEIVSVRVDCPIPKMCIFAKRIIVAGEELCFDYSGGCSVDDQIEKDVTRKHCFCGSDCCRKFIPNVKFDLNI